MSTSSHAPRRGTNAVVDAIEAVVATERLCARGLGAEDAPRGTDATENAFGESVERLGGDLHDARAAFEACERAAARGGRVAAIVSAASIADARRALSGLVERRRPVVIHAIV